MGFIAPAAMAFGAVTSFVDGMVSATAAERAAKAARREGEEAMNRRQRDAARQQGALRARAAASGAGLEGSAADVLDDLASDAALEALSLRYQGLRQAAAYRAQASQARSRSTSSLLGDALNLAGYGNRQGWFSDEKPPA